MTASYTTELKITEHNLHQSVADGFGGRVFEVYMVCVPAKAFESISAPAPKRNVWRFAKRHQAEWIVNDMRGAA